MTVSQYICLLVGSLDLERRLRKADGNLRVIHGAKNRACKEKQLGVY